MASYLLLPPLHRLIEKDYFRTDQLLFPVLALLAYAVTVRRHRLALGAALLALCIRESGALAVVGLGVYWLCVERRVRAGLGLVALGALWMPMVSYLLLPAVIGHPTPHADQVRAPSQLADQLAAFWAVRWPVGAAAAVALLLLRRRWAALLAVPALVAFLFYRTDLRYVAPLFSIVWMAVADEVTDWEGPDSGARRSLRPSGCSRWPTWRWARGGRPRTLASGTPGPSLRACRRTPACAPSPACSCTSRSASGSTSSIASTTFPGSREGVSMPSTSC